MMPLVAIRADTIMRSGRTAAEGHPGALAFGDRLFPFFSIVDADLFRNSVSVRHAARKRLHLPDDALVIGNVNNVNPMKGHDVFVQAAAIVRRDYPDARFVVLGAQYDQHSAYTRDLLRTAAS